MDDPTDNAQVHPYDDDDDDDKLSPPVLSLESDNFPGDAVAKLEELIKSTQGLIEYVSEVTVHPKLTKEYRQGGSPQRRPVFTNPEADQEGEKITNIMTRTYKLNQPLQSAVDIVEALRVYQAGHDALLARASAQLHEARVHRDEAQDQRDEAWAQRDEAQAEVARAEARAALAEARAEAMVAQSAQAQAQAQIAKAQAKIHHTEAVRARRENQQLLATLAGMRDQRKKANISSRLIGDESPHGAPNRTGDTNSGNIKAPGEEQDDALLPALP